MNSSPFFSPGRLGPLTLRNRSIRAAAFEGMSQGHEISQELIDYHLAVARGGIGMTTVAYASVSRHGLSFPHQLWIREEAAPGLRELVDRVHEQGAAISIQLGHCGNMASRAVTGIRPLAPCGGVNWYGPTFPRGMKEKDIAEVVADFGRSVALVADCGFDAVEIHAGHGYLISQFLSPYTNRRKDGYGGSFENRSRFMREALRAVRKALPEHMALVVKMNASDGFSGGISEEESRTTAGMIEACGGDAIVVSGGFVSRSPMFILRGSMPVEIMAYFMHRGLQRFFVKRFGRQLIRSHHFHEGYFMEEARRIREHVGIPVVLVGGMNSMTVIDRAMDEGFPFIAMARALIENSSFINDLQREAIRESACTVCNYCVAKMYTDTMSCYLHDPIPSDLEPLVQKLDHG